MSNLLEITPNRVQISTTFDTNKSYLYKDTSVSTDTNLIFTKILSATNLLVYQETLENLTRDPEYDRFDYGPAAPTRGPFFENYFTNTGFFKYDPSNLINLLLIDKPPVRTGYFKFIVGDAVFNGLITRQTPYEFYNWQRVGTGYQSYDYVLQSTPLGYGIEISESLLYTTRWVDTPTFDDNVSGYWEAVPTPLLLTLRNLKGNEEIISFATSDNVADYIIEVQGLSTPTSIPIDVSSLSPADALRYIASYQDLINSLGADYKRGQNHYNNTGFREGRKITFDPIAYLNKYADLRQRYGFNTYDATIHYIQFGYRENRTIENSSSTTGISGGLYDERTSILPTTSSSIVWPNGSTLAGKGKILTYKLGTSAYYINGNLPVENNLLYLKVQ